MAFEKFMRNKYFHPGSIQNIKKVWEAQQRELKQTKKEKELQRHYMKQHEIYQNKEQLGQAHPLSFMYDPPPGYDKEQDGRKCERLTLMKAVDTGQPSEAPEDVIDKAVVGTSQETSRRGVSEQQQHKTEERLHRTKKHSKYFKTKTKKHTMHKNIPCTKTQTCKTSYKIY